jgi:hypothetical protein
MISLLNIKRGRSSSILSLLFASLFWAFGALLLRGQINRFTQLGCGLCSLDMAFSGEKRKLASAERVCGRKDRDHSNVGCRGCTGAPDRRSVQVIGDQEGACVLDFCSDLKKRQKTIERVKFAYAGAAERAVGRERTSRCRLRQGWLNQDALSIRTWSEGRIETRQPQEILSHVAQHSG